MRKGACFRLRRILLPKLVIELNYEPAWKVNDFCNSLQKSDLNTTAINAFHNSLDPLAPFHPLIHSNIGQNSSSTKWLVTAGHFYEQRSQFRLRYLDPNAYGGQPLPQILSIHNPLAASVRNDCFSLQIETSERSPK